MAEHYLALKHLHITTVIITLFLFILRGFWMLTDSSQLQRRWVKIVPHINDTLLLASALLMAFIIGQYPFVNSPWLTAKVVGLLAYIGLGTLAIKRGRSKRVRAVAWSGALLIFGYIVAVALSKNPLPGSY
ncbi:MAG: SirB2 family protein [Candidatus Competibacteraceae bacterium]|nr:SirB2 family protein [Candidatus Competibacteraceae bacterium]